MNINILLFTKAGGLHINHDMNTRLRNWQILKLWCYGGYRNFFSITAVPHPNITLIGCSFSYFILMLIVAPLFLQHDSPPFDLSRFLSLFSFLCLPDLAHCSEFAGFSR